MRTLAVRWGIQLVSYAEDGEGRLGDTDRIVMSGLDGSSLIQFGKLSAPILAMASSYRCAGHAAILGYLDAIIATKNTWICCMAGPAMLRGGGVGWQASGYHGLRVRTTLCFSTTCVR